MAQTTVSDVNSLSDILSILPHRYPFLFVDRITEFIPGQRIAATKRFSVNDEAARGYLPASPIISVGVLMELVTQLGAVLVMERPEMAGKVAMILQIPAARLTQRVEPGDTLRVEAEVIKIGKRLGELRGAIFRAGELVAEGNLRFAIAEAAQILRKESGVRSQKSEVRSQNKDGRTMARNNLQELDAIVSRFFKKVSLDCGAEVERHKFRLTEFLNVEGDIWKHYGGWSGVYYLYSDDGLVHYVGEGTTVDNGVGYRVRDAVKRKSIEEAGMNVGLIFLAEPDLPFGLALEQFLIRDLSPRLNKLGKRKVGSK
jgi:3-hydroxyacyl-[acyl-carrier-protein] dehydratase